MTEFDCLAIIDDKEYEFLTMGAVTVVDAMNQFCDYLSLEANVDPELAEAMLFNEVDVSPLN
ncbi:hypothetical protein [Marisediminitalea sp.]|uniref:hypothetical protein n=1 Tax=Marisediminitalea sp. TaxID=2662268 RepID=UPI003511B65E